MKVTLNFISISLIYSCIIANIVFKSCWELDCLDLFLGGVGSVLFFLSEHFNRMVFIFKLMKKMLFLKDASQGIYKVLKIGKWPLLSYAIFLVYQL